MKAIIHIYLPVLLTLAPLTASAQDSTYTTTSEEPSRGGAKIAGGIVLTTLGGTVGGLIFLLGVFERPSCSSEDDERDTPECKRATRGSDNLIGTGAVIAGASLGGGIPLIVSGARDRKKWKSWKAEQVHEGEARRPGKTLNLGFKREDQGGAATLTFDY